MNQLGLSQISSPGPSGYELKGRFVNRLGWYILLWQLLLVNWYGPILFHGY